MTPEAAIHSALMARVLTLSLTPSLPLIYVERGGDKPASYIEVAHLPNTNERALLSGSDPLDRQGILQLTLCSKPGQYAAVYIETAGNIAAHFPRDMRLTADGKSVEITKADIGAGRMDGQHWRTPVSIYYRGRS
jgi:hypothetical protein